MDGATEEEEEAGAGAEVAEVKGRVGEETEEQGLEGAAAMNKRE